jgi:DNA-binding IclR family transcriptional regulator
MPQSDDSGIKSAARSFRILETLVDAERCTVSELTERTPYTVSTVYEHLSTLRDLGYVLKEGDKTYRPSATLLRLGTRTRRSRVPERPVRSTVSNLADRTKQVVWFTITEQTIGVNLYKSVGTEGIQTFGREGKEVHLHCSAAGKAMLAAFPDDRVDAAITERGLPAYTNNTITDPDALRAELDRVREQGFARCDCETVENVRAVGAAVAIDDDMVGAITVGGPQSRLQGDYYESELPQLVVEHANELELRLEYQ